MSILLKKTLLFSWFMLGSFALLFAQTHYQNGKKAYRKGEYKKAKKLFRKALNEAGDDEQLVLKSLNRLGLVSSKLRENKAALSFFEKVEALLLKTGQKDSLSVAHCWKNMGKVYNQLYEPNQAVESYEKARRIYAANMGQNSSDYGNVLMDMAGSFMKMGDYISTERYYLQAFEIFKKSSLPESKDFYRIYNNLGLLYRREGDYQKALDYGQRALEIKLKHYAANHPSVAKYHRNLAKALIGLGRLEEAKPYYEKTIAIFQASIGERNAQTAGALAEYATVLTDLGDTQKAILVHQKAAQIYQKTLPSDHPYLIGNYFSLANAYAKQGDYQKAFANFRPALKSLERRNYPPKIEISIGRYDMAQVFLQQNELDSALLYCQKSLSSLADDFFIAADNFLTNPPLEKVEANLTFLEVLQLKITVLFAHYQESQEIETLKAAVKTTHLAVALLEKIRGTYSSTTSKQALQTATVEVYQKGVKGCFELHQRTGKTDYLWQAFLLSEKSKANQLWNTLMENNAFDNAGLSSKEQAELVNLNRLLKQVKEDYFDCQNNGKDEQAEILKAKLFDLKLQQEEQLKGLQQQYPKFYDLRYASITLDQNSLQNALKANNSALIEYFYDVQDLYIFVVTTDEIKVWRNALPIDLKEEIRDFRAYNISNLTNVTQQQFALDYSSLLHDFYATLIAPIYSSIQQKEKLLIISHGFLNYLSFETLCPKIPEADFRKQRYLLFDYAIQYNWSAAIWLKKSQQKESRRQQFIGFAPTFYATNEVGNFRSILTDLQYAPVEIKNANVHFSGQLYEQEKATEANFRRAAPQASILHLATHTLIDDADPMHSGLAFFSQNDSLYDGFLKTYEIYNLDLNAHLAVVSSCDTGFGQVAEGEGVISLGRAFFYAGCRSVVMSQWLVNDQSSAQIMTYFYQFLAEGMPKDQALQEAKIAYLRTADQLTAHPYFWGNLVAYGDMQSLKQEQTYYYWFAIIGVIGLLLFAFWWKN